MTKQSPYRNENGDLKHLDQLELKGKSFLDPTVNSVEVHPFFNNEFSLPAPFLKKTNTTYCKLPWGEFEGRRHPENRLLQSIVSVLPDNCCVAGGAMVDWWYGNKDTKDFDIFVNSQQSFVDVYNSIVDYSEDPDGDTFAYEGYDLVEPKDEIGSLWIHHPNTRYVTFVNKKHPTRPKIQLMKIAWYDDPTHVIDSFDFTVAQIAGDHQFVYFNPLTFLDLHHKRLVLHRMQFPASTMRRLIKYSQKGFYCCPQSMIDISEKIMEYKGEQIDIDMNRNVYYLD